MFETMVSNVYSSTHQFALHLRVFFQQSAIKTFRKAI